MPKKWRRLPASVAAASIRCHGGPPHCAKVAPKSNAGLYKGLYVPCTLSVVHGRAKYWAHHRQAVGPPPSPASRSLRKLEKGPPSGKFANPRNSSPPGNGRRNSLPLVPRWCGFPDFRRKPGNPDQGYRGSLFSKPGVKGRECRKGVLCVKAKSDACLSFRIDCEHFEVGLVRNRHPLLQKKLVVQICNQVSLENPLPHVLLGKIVALFAKFPEEENPWTRENKGARPSCEDRQQNANNE